MFLKKVNFDFSTLSSKSYLNTLPYVDIDSISFSKPIVFLTGDNGVGKSTLLESLAYHFNMNREGGSNNFILDKTNVSPLFEYTSIEGSQSISYGFFFRSDTFFSIEEVLDQYGKDLKYTYNGGDKTFKEQSHGESFMSFFRSRLGSNALYFFDEPENALSFENQVLFLFLLKEFEAQGNQIIIVTHSPVLLSYPNAQIISIKKEGIEDVAYENTEQFSNYKNFLENYKSYQKEILNFD